MQRDTMVNYIDGGNDRRMPRDVEIFDPASLENPFCEANDMNESADDTDGVDGKDIKGDLNVNYAMTEGGTKGTLRDVEAINPEDISINLSAGYIAPRVHDVEVFDGPSSYDLQNDLKVNDFMEKRDVRVPRDVELFSSADL